MNHSQSYTATLRFWLVLILTICVLCTISACGGSSSDELEPEPPTETVPPTTSGDGVIHTPTVPAPKTRI
jgi:hypothetical protein